MRDEKLVQDAEALVEYIRAFRSMLKRFEQNDNLPMGLTTPQISVLRELIVTDGLSLKGLSQRVGLAQSTVSGIVDRLERHDLVHRITDPKDKRSSRVTLDPKVMDYVNSTFYAQRSQILAEALSALSTEERNQIMASFARVYSVLHDYLETLPSEPPEPPEPS